MRVLYAVLMRAGTPLLGALLTRRSRRGKEDPARLPERRGTAGLPRPAGRLLWLHAASVGEAQSALILLEALLARDPALHILVTTGTVTSATMMAQRLPTRAMHQFVPLDQPEWVARFLDHWRPDRVLWMESELWPNMLAAVKARRIPAALVNARLSERSVRNWRMARGMIGGMLATFDVILAQTAEDAANFHSLGAQNVIVTDNIKYAAAPLPVDDGALAALKQAIGARPFWLYASTHAGEEEMACRLHKALAAQMPDLLTIIAPRHPERRTEIAAVCAQAGVSHALRSSGAMPDTDTQVYVADTLGELGLLYRLSPVSCVGRSLSADGGGGHNPIEPALLGSAVLHGPYIQNLAALYEDMDSKGAALCVKDEQTFAQTLKWLLTDAQALSALQKAGHDFVVEKNAVLGRILVALDQDPAGRAEKAA